MTSRKLSAFIDAIATGRRPKRFRAAPEDVEVLRAAVDLRAARPGEAEPTAAFTDALTNPASRHTAIQVPQRNALRTGTFQTADGQVLGQIVAYRGNPSWVFMNVDVPNYTGTVKCMLQVDDGSTVAFGTFTVQRGTGQFSKNIGSVDVGHLRGAKLVTSTGSPVADATFAA
jgi:hypothetical protein